jgi:regulator of protease activity HflC (stomatin/prohibitin superfamily)
MVVLRYLLVAFGIGLLVGAAVILAWDLFQILKFRRQPVGEQRPALRWHARRKLAAMYPGVHGTIPLIEKIETYNIRDSEFTTAPVVYQKSDDPKKATARVQTSEGLMVGMAVAVRYRLGGADAERMKMQVSVPSG